MEDYYGNDQIGEFLEVPADEIQGGDVLPSHDGLYHTVETAVSFKDGTVSAIITRGPSEGRGEAYNAEWDAGSTVRVLA